MSKDGDKADKPEVQAESKPAEYRVFDMNQRGPIGRKHDVITKFYPDGSHDPEIHTYELFSGGSGAPMPMEHAMRFLVDPAFKVLAPNGNRIMPVPKFDISRPITQLGEDELVVRYDELSRDSLFRRCKVLPGSEQIGANAKPDDMIRFLRGWREKLRGMTPAERELAEKMTQGGLGGAMTNEQLLTMFPQSQSQKHMLATG